MPNPATSDGPGARIASRRRPPVSSRAGSGCLILFGLPFAGVGLFALVQSLRELRHGDGSKSLLLALFAFVFGAAGLAVIAAAIFGSKAQKKSAALEAAHPQEPWLWRPDWSRGEIKSSQANTMWFIWGFAAFWNAIASAATLAALKDAPKNKAAYLVLLFPAVGIVLLAWATRLTLQRRRFGNPMLRMAAVPGVIGGALAGVVHVPRSLHGAEEIRLRLICLERDSSGEHTTESPRWEDEKTLSADVLHEGGGIPVLFNIPYESAPTEQISASREIIWRLEVRAALPGSDFLASFDVPVFKTQQSRAEATPLPDPAAIYEKPVDLARSAGIRVKPSAGGGSDIIFGAARNKGAAVTFTLFALLWTGSVVVMIRLGAPKLFPVVFGVFDLLLLAFLPSLWLARSRVTVDASGLKLVTRTFLEKQRFLSADEIQSVESKFSMSAGNRMYYDLLAVTSGARKVVLARYIPSKKEVEWLVHEIKKALRKA